MTFKEIEETPTLADPCIIVIVKNESYLKSLQLLRDDVNAGRLRAIYFPVENPDLFDSDPESDVAVYCYNMLEGPEGYSYGRALLNIPRSRPDIVITEHSENKRALRSGAMFGVHMAKDTPITEENSLYPVDSMIRSTQATGSFPFAITMPSETIEESIRSLHHLVQEEVQRFIHKTLKLAYMDGKRWEITEDQVLLALHD